MLNSLLLVWASLGNFKKSAVWLFFVILSASMVEVTVNLPYINGDLISMFHQYGIAVYAQHGEESVILSGELPVNVARRFSRYRCE